MQPLSWQLEGEGGEEEKFLRADRPIRGSTRGPRRPKNGPNIFFQCSKMIEMIL